MGETHFGAALPKNFGYNLYSPPPSPQALTGTGSNPEWISLQPVLHNFGSLSNGLGSFDSDLDLILRFDRFEEVGLLDYETAMLALECLEMVLIQRMGVPMDHRFLVRSHRCPLLKLEFAQCYPYLADKQRPTVVFNKCDISANALYGVYNR